MKVIEKGELWSFLDGAEDAQRTTSMAVRQGPGYRITTYMELVTKIAELQFRNLDYVLLLRGQTGDYRNIRNSTTLKPSLFRSLPGSKSAPLSGELKRRFDRLETAERELVTRYAEAGFLGRERLTRYRILRWAILQHYEICPTPFLDVTHSLRIAASFASLDASGGDGFVYVLGVPSISGAITACAEANLQILRLSSVCPPSALRPHVQEGYVLGEYPDMIGYDQKAHYPHYEIDFGRRLVAKFRFAPATFWDDTTFPQVERGALYPASAADPLFELAVGVKAAIT